MAITQHRQQCAASRAVDGLADTFWAADPSIGFRKNKAEWRQWLAVDLQQTCVVSHVDVKFGEAWAKTFEIWLSNDGRDWQIVGSFAGHRTDLFRVAIADGTPRCRHIRIVMTSRGDLRRAYTIYALTVWGTEVA